MKLHQLIVSEPEIRGSYAKITQETSKRFKDGHIFSGYSKIYTPSFEGGQPLEPDTKELVTTVPKRLDYTKDAVVEMLDYEASRDSTNCEAKADLVVDGVALGKDLPATFLLSLEGKLKEIRAYYDEAPTLELSKKWDKTDNSTDIYRTSSIAYRTAKQTKGIVLSPATDKHPAQVKEVVEDVKVGQFDTVSLSGAIHPGTKAELMRRIDKLITATKQARMKANEQEVKNVNVGKNVFSYINGN